jgi:hypothetical protein
VCRASGVGNHRVACLAVHSGAFFRPSQIAGKRLTFDQLTGKISRPVSDGTEVVVAA